MNSKYFVTDEIRTWEDVEAFHDRLGQALKLGEISQLDWELRYREACSQVMNLQKERVIESISEKSGNQIQCECGGMARYKGRKKKLLSA